MKRAIAAAVFAASLAGSGGAQAADLENTLYMDLTYGRVVIELRPDLAPKTVARMKELTRQHFFDGVVFHRVISGFMAQTGDPTGTGYGRSGKPLPAEFSDAHHVRGTVSMPVPRTRTAPTASSSSLHRRAPARRPIHYLGQVVQGMNCGADQARRQRSQRHRDPAPGQDVKMQVAADEALTPCLGGRFAMLASSIAPAEAEASDPVAPVAWRSRCWRWRRR
jgi:peptidylprolyl isomerase